MTPPRKGEGEGEERNPRADETEEYELGDDFLDEIDDPDELEEEEVEEGPDDEDLDDEDLDDEDLDDEDQDEGLDGEEVSKEDELEQIVSAETQEWDGLEAAEDEAEEEAGEPTLVASAGAKMKQAGSAITSGFAKVRRRRDAEAPGSIGGERIGSGSKRIRRWRPGFPVWLRFLTASLVIVGSIAGATSASLILYLSDIASALRHNDLVGVQDKLSTVEPGAPQTILILGSDKRPEMKDLKFKGLSDTTMLLRLDPDRNAISLLSLPRDLKVEIPGVGTDKLNAAYAYGGPQLTLQTVENLLSTPGHPFEVNHLVNVDFEGFARAVNAIDCVYVDVDRRYFHSNDYTSASEDYEEINLQPGYQALCGFDALDYARYRHTDNDVVRAARQQEFLREARAKIPPKKLLSDRKELISIFTEHTSSDIDSWSDMLDVLKLFLDARDKPVKEVHFEGTLGPSYVTATPEELQTAVSQFLGFEGSPNARRTSAAPESPVVPETAPDQTPVTPAAPGGGKAKSHGSVDNQVSLTPTTYGKELARSIRARDVKLPVFYPTELETGSDFAQKPRVYKINGTGEGSPPPGERAAYKWVFARPELGEYYGFEGTRWRDPPILSDPDDEKTIHGRDYKLFYDDNRLRMIAWQTDEGSFWLSNTLIESLSNTEMLKVAEAFRQLPGT